LDTRDRRKQSERLAWQLIDSARGSETSGARIQALEELNEEGVSLRGLDADGADLIQINLRRANLTQANLKGANLQSANLYKANLYKAKLQKANLRGANFQGADLWGANLEEANLQEREPDLDGRDVDIEDQITNLKNAKLCRANLRKAVLQNADLSGADLRGAFLQGADLRNACLKEANLYGTCFGNAYLTIEQVQLAKDDSWKHAKYDINFCQNHHLFNLLLDDSIDIKAPEPPLEFSPELKLLGVIHGLLLTKEIDKQKEVTAIRQKIMELIQLLDNESLVPLKAHPLVGELTSAVENLTSRDEILSNVSTIREAETRTVLASLKDALQEQNKAYDHADELECQAQEHEKQAEKYKRSYREAGEWLKTNQERIKSQALGYYLTQYLNASQNDYIENIVQITQLLEADIDACLNQLVYCLYKPEKPHYRGIIFNLPLLIRINIFKVISEQVIPEMLTHSFLNLSEASLSRLNAFIKSSISYLQQQSEE